MTDAGSRYDQLLQSPVVDRDPWTRPNLQAFRPRHELLLRLLDAELTGPRRSIVDVGCHNGFFLRLAADLGFESVIGVDFFELPPERSFLLDLPQGQFVKTNFHEPDFLRELPDGSQDVVVSTEVFEHLLEHPVSYLEETWRVVRPGGLMLFSTPNPGTLMKGLKTVAGRSPTWGDVEFATVPKTGTDGTNAAMWDIHFREYQPRDLIGLLERLPAAKIVHRGFVANAPACTDSAWGQRAKALVRRTGLGSTRLMGATQWYVLRRGR
jgi:SAM-dependent methyltransferase